MAHEPSDSGTQSGPGVCLWLTGRSGAGKSTLVRSLTSRLEEFGRTYSTLDVVPLLAKHPLERTSEGKLLRKAFVAGEIAKHGGIAICVTVSARAATRESAREIVGEDRFIEIYVDAPAEVCRERKSFRTKKAPLHKRVRRAIRGAKRRLSGNRDDYEVPSDPDVVVDSVSETPEDGARRVVSELVRRGFLDESGARTGGPTPAGSAAAVDT